MKSRLKYVPRFCATLALLVWIWNDTKSWAVTTFATLSAIEAELCALSLRVHRERIDALHKPFPKNFPWPDAQ